jgi:hypothetical protein
VAKKGIEGTEEDGVYNDGGVSGNWAAIQGSPSELEKASVLYPGSHDSTAADKTQDSCANVQIFT